MTKCRWFAIVALVAFVVSGVVACGDDSAPPDVAGRYALRIAQGESETESLSFVLLEQDGTAMTLRDETSLEVIGTGTITVAGDVTIRWVNDPGGDRQASVKHATTESIPNMADHWLIEGNVPQPDPYGLKSWRLERMDHAFHAYLGSTGPEEEEQMQGSTWNPSMGLPDAPGNGHQQIIDAGLLPILPASQTPGDKKALTPSTTPQGDVLQCTSQPFSDRIVTQLEKGTLVTADPSVLYPGSVVQGMPLARDGDYLPVNIRRSGGTIFLQGLALAKGATYSRTVDEMTASRTSQAISEMLSDSEVRGTAANFIFNTHRVYSYDQALLELGIDARYGSSSMKGSLNIDSTKQKNYILVTFTQIFYSVVYEKGVRPEDVFKDGASFSDPDNVIRPGNPPMYISSVDYGRQVYFLVESTESEETIKTTLDGAFKGTGAEVKVDSKQTYKDVMKNSKVTYWVRGGAADLALQPIRDAAPDQMYDALKLFLSKPEAANFSPANPGEPVSYTVKYLLNDKVVAANMSAAFDKVDCHIAASGAHRWTLRYEGMNYRTTVSLNGMEIYDRNSGSGQTKSATIDFSVQDSDDNRLSLVLSNGDCFSSSGNYYVLKDGVEVWQIKYGHGWGNCGDQLTVSFKFNNRAGGQFEQDYCKALRGASYKVDTDKCPP